MFRTTFSRRRVITGATSLALTAPFFARAALAQGVLEAAKFGVVPESLEDQSAAVQEALLAARDQGQTLLLPRGQIFVRNLEFPGETNVVGQPGAMLVAWENNPVGKAVSAADLSLQGIGFSAGGVSNGADGALLEIEGSVRIRVVNCGFAIGGGNGLVIRDSDVLVEDCDFEQLGGTAIFSHNSRGLVLSGNRIATCGNAGIRIWRDEAGADGSMVIGNRIAAIRTDAGGNGQNGNAINIFKADGVIVADNHLTDSAFSAIRLNSTRNTQVRGNVCLNSGEVAIFSEFAFSGSVITDNIIDGAAVGISITNFDQGGALAVCSGNLVRNIQPLSIVNPDTSPIGISAEAHAAITGNVVEFVPGVGIKAGWGPYLEDVLISGNVVRESNIGLGVSVAPGAGSVSVTDNLVSGSRMASIAGLAWRDVETADLVRDAGRYPHVTISGNRIS